MGKTMIRIGNKSPSVEGSSFQLIASTEADQGTAAGERRRRR
jgi:hypothetical protein